MKKRAVIAILKESMEKNYYYLMLGAGCWGLRGARHRV